MMAGKPGDFPKEADPDPSFGRWRRVVPYCSRQVLSLLHATIRCIKTELKGVMRFPLLASFNA